MRLGVRIFVWLSAAIVLLGMTAAAFAAVTEADIGYIKHKLETGQTLTAADLKLAEEINTTTTSYIDINAELERAKNEGTGYVQEPRAPRNTLDVYQWATTGYEWIDISTTGTALVPGDDSNQGPFQLGFTFTFYDQPYSTIRVCTNGFMSFTSTSSTLTNTAIPNAAQPNAAIYPFWDDMITATGAGEIKWFADTTNGRFIVSWLGVPHYYSPRNSNHPYTFQAVIYENGSIRFNYQTVQTDTIPGDTSCTVGIENATGTEALQICFNGTGTLPASNTSFIISQPNGVPNPVTELEADEVGDNVLLTWLDPTQDTNGQPLTVDSVVVLWGATRLAGLGAGVQTYTHVNPPDGNQTYTVIAYNDGFASVPASVSIFVGNFGYASDFEANDGGWDVNGGGWEWGTPTDPDGPPAAHSGTNCWGTVLAGDYANNACYSLELNLGLVVLSPTATVEFWTWYKCEGDFSPWDGFNFQVSVDGGSSWTILIPDVGYSDETSNNDCIGENPNRNGTDVTDWNYWTVQVGDYVG
ncbi:MAG: hypothetical protein ACOZB3_05580, partial [Calditrichota bacterium]